MMSRTSLGKAGDFIACNGRMIERRLFDYHFCGGPSEAVLHSVLAYRNSDGGFGHGMEPDTSSPESQPLFVSMALQVLDEANCFELGVVMEALAYIESVTADCGGVPWMLNPKGSYPRASHFDSVDERPAINPTAPILGLLLKHGVVHPWMEKAELFCWEAISKSKEVKCSDCTRLRLVFLEQRSEDKRSKEEIDKIAARIRAPGLLCNDFSEPNIGMFGKPTPINYAPSPTSVLRPIFSEEEMNAHLDALIQRQKSDGRWQNPWGISEGTRLEWDGMYTLESLKILRAYGRIEVES